MLLNFLPLPVLHLLKSDLPFTRVSSVYIYELDIISVITKTCKYVIKFDVNHNKSSDLQSSQFHYRHLRNEVYELISEYLIRISQTPSSSVHDLLCVEKRGMGIMRE